MPVCQFMLPNLMSSCKTLKWNPTYVLQLRYCTPPAFSCNKSLIATDRQICIVLAAGVDGVLSAEGLLTDPALFSPSRNLPGVSRGTEDTAYLW